jgi:predicted metal-binding protein
MAARLTQQVRSDWSRAILVCRKCSKKLDGGFGHDGKRPLAKALRKYLGIKKGRKAPVGIVEVGCLGVCTKNAVTLIDAEHPAVWRIVPAGQPLGETARMLSLPAA